MYWFEQTRTRLRSNFCNLSTLVAFVDKQTKKKSWPPLLSISRLSALALCIFVVVRLLLERNVLWRLAVTRFRAVPFNACCDKAIDVLFSSFFFNYSCFCSLVGCCSLCFCLASSFSSFSLCMICTRKSILHIGLFVVWTFRAVRCYSLTSVDASCFFVIVDYDIVMRTLREGRCLHPYRGRFYDSSNDSCEWKFFSFFLSGARLRNTLNDPPIIANLCDDGVGSCRIWWDSIVLVPSCMA